VAVDLKVLSFEKQRKDQYKEGRWQLILVRFFAATEKGLSFPYWQNPGATSTLILGCLICSRFKASRRVVGYVL
jgi:hypothetical protein